MGIWRDEIQEHVNARLTTVAQARQVREWRVNGDGAPDGASWRRVADLAHEAWGDWVTPGNQIYGWAICTRAAELLGEDPNVEPWN